MKILILSLLRIYKNTLSPVLLPVFGHGCKYYPTCSSYAYESIEKHGVAKGALMSFKRFLSCNSF